MSDTETTGFAQNHIVELASVIKMNNGDVYHWYSKCKPSSPIEDGAAQVHGITNAMVANERQDIEAVAQWWKDVCDLQAQSKEAMVISGHNISYDLRALRRYVTIPLNTLTLCTMKLGRKYNPESPNHKLVELHNYLGLTGDYAAHSALDDVFMHENIVNYYVSKLGFTYQALARQQMQPTLLKIMPFGKHKGTEFAVLDSGYMEYMLRIQDLDNDVRFSMENELSTRANRTNRRAW